MEIQPIRHPLTGLFEGIQRGISLGLTMKELKQKQKEREELLNLQKQKAQAEREYQERQNDIRMFESGLKFLGDQKMPKGVKLDIYNKMVAPTGKKLGIPLEVINDWPDGIDEYVKQISAIYNNKDYSWKEKQDFITSILLKAGADPNLEHVMANIRERRKEEELSAEQRAYDLHYKWMSGEKTPDEIEEITYELKDILKKHPYAYKSAFERAKKDRRDELLMQKKEHKLYYNPKTGQTMYVDVYNRDEVENARNQGYLPWAADVFKSQAGESKYTLPQKLDDLRAEYNRRVDALDRKYGLKGGGLTSKTLFDIDETSKAKYIQELDDINASYNEEYKKLTGRNAPFLVSPKTTNTGKQSSGIKPSLEEIFKGK